VPQLEPLLLPAAPPGPEAPLPYYMATGQVLRRPVVAGALLTRADVTPPAGSVLWALRDEQDAMV
jgi:predicted homoserine dehydrogenase-like protein